jgi:ERCC4-related helicase
MTIKELYVMAVIDNMQITSHLIYNVNSDEDIYKYFEKKYKSKVIIQHRNGTHLIDEKLDKIINWNHTSLFLYVHLYD